MKKVICIYNGIEIGHGERLTIGKIYDVISSVDNFICIKDNKGDNSNYVMISGDKVWFEDATSYIREDKLNEILNG